ncbi:hypothetical protein ACGFI9_21780 [Micromonospora sp. NPDC048930]|uniref:hypothetical protein n=1 Tax=Micromonospora sp. NPDC048930 TaxID=3364261 RepID=UPI00371916C0
MTDTPTPPPSTDLPAEAGPLPSFAPAGPLHGPPPPYPDRHLEAYAGASPAGRRRAREAALRHTLRGVDLGAYDLHYVTWLAGFDTETAQTIASWLERVRLVGHRQGYGSSSAADGGDR